VPLGAVDRLCYTNDSLTKEARLVKHIIPIIWGMLLGLVIGFIGAALTQTKFQVGTTLIVTAIGGALLNIIAMYMEHQVKNVKA
jgi:hypothetical protein